MNILVTLDYELFFGTSGSLEKCIIEPTERLLSLANKHTFKCVFFIDAGYLVALKRSFTDYPELKKDYQLVSEQIRKLSSSGHQIQLHIHPHWEDSFYDGYTWKFNLSRFRMDAFSEDEIDVIFKTYKTELETISGKTVFVYRAGGWCIQPFDVFRKAFLKHGIKIDSTVFLNGKNSTPVQWFDFSNAPDKSSWRFGHDPCVEDTKGEFVEIPISSIRVPPFFYWKFVAKKFMGKNHHQSFGDGTSSKSSRFQQLKLMLLPSNSVVSMDGYKASLLDKAYKKNIMENFVIIGHPKAFTEYSLNKFEKFITKVKSDGNSVITYPKF